jgi:hypothetical protein
MVQATQLHRTTKKQEQNSLALGYCILFLISYLALQALISGNHYFWSAFTRKIGGVA